MFNLCIDATLCCFHRIFSLGRPLSREPLRFASSPANDVIGEELNLHDDHFALNSPTTNQMKDNLTPQEEELVFFRSVVFSPEVPIRLDYHGKSVNMDQVFENKSS